MAKFFERTIADLKTLSELDIKQKEFNSIRNEDNEPKHGQQTAKVQKSLEILNEL